jgi:hypothetical protein
MAIDRTTDVFRPLLRMCLKVIIAVHHRLLFRSRLSTYASSFNGCFYYKTDNRKSRRSAFQATSMEILLLIIRFDLDRLVPRLIAIENLG